MESFDTDATLLARFSSFDPDTLEVRTQFGDVDKYLESWRYGGQFGDQPRKDGLPTMMIQISGFLWRVLRKHFTRHYTPDLMILTTPYAAVYQDNPTSHTPPEISRWVLTPLLVLLPKSQKENALKNISLVSKNSALTKKLATSTLTSLP
jgi:hypothetical protein